MTNEECPFFFSCDAPLCPFYNFNGIWYADETICKNPKYSKLDVIKNQKKISRINKRHEVQGFFTYNMLNRLIIVRKGISGLNEDQDLKDIVKSENAWVQKHKGMSNELRVRMSEHMKKVRNMERGIENVH
jgi:hypothetical protein